MLRWLCLVLLCWGGCGNVWAQPAAHANTEQLHLGAGVAVLEDPSGQLTLDEVRQPAMAARFVVPAQGGDLNFGFTASAYWLRLPLQRQADAPARWLLEVPYGQIDSLQLYAPQGQVWHTGNASPLSSRPVFHRHFVFPIELDTEAQFFYLRATSSHSLTVPLVLWSATGFHHHEQRELILQFLYYGALLSLLVYNLLLYGSLRDQRFLFYSLYVLCMGLGILAGNGYGRLFIWTEAVAFDNLAQSTFLSVAGLFAGHFTRLFLQTAQRLPRLDRCLQAHTLIFLLLALGFVAALHWPMPVRSFNQWILLNGFGMVLVIAVAGWQALRAGESSARSFLLAWGFLLLGVLVAGLRAFDYLPTNGLTSYALQIASTFEMLLLSLALADMIHAERRAREQSQQQMLALLRSSEEKLERAVRERTAELEAANAQLQVLGHTDGLTGLANRRLFDQTLARACSTEAGQHVALIMLDVDYFKPYNDHYGHLAGDHCLQQLAQVLASQAAPLPHALAARYGGEEFAIIVTRSSTDEVSALAEGVRAGVLALALPHRGAPAGMVTISLGVAQWMPSAGCCPSPQALIQQADLALYCAKQAGRNQVQWATGVGQSSH
jgi:two-component system, sensor histidine kinase LadS